MGADTEPGITPSRLHRQAEPEPDIMIICGHHCEFDVFIFDAPNRLTQVAGQ